MPALAQEGPYTWDDFVALDEEDLRELIDGDLVEVDVSATLSHEHIAVGLVYFLRRWSEQGHGGLVLGSRYKVRIGHKRGVMPDAHFYRKGNPAPRGQEVGLVEGRPDLVVEIISRSSRRYDRVIKLGYYQAIGVPEYWLVDPDARTIERLVLGGDAYSIVQVAAERGTFRPEGWDGLEIDLAKLWTPEGG